MDVTRLSETLGWLRNEESQNKIQGKLNTLRDHLQNLTGSPGDSNHQLEFSKSLEELDSALSKIEASYDPAQMGRIREIGGEPFFSRRLVDRIRAQLTANPMSPATALEDVNQLLESRAEFVANVESTEAGVDFFVPYENGLEAGSAAIGFEIPRTIFDNEFKDFISELRVLQRIVRVFAEVEIGSVPEIKLGKISSTDPLIFLDAPPILVASIAASVSWLLTQWKKFEEIRKIRAETVKLGQFEAAEIEEFFDKKISERLDKAIDEKVSEMVEGSQLKDARKAELDSELAWALKALFARVERGMRVEVQTRLLEDNEELTPVQEEQQVVLRRVEKVAGELTFPRIEPSEPILQLPRLAENEGTPARGRPKS